MASIKELSSGRKDMFFLRADQMSVKEGWNSRDMSDPANIAHIESLAQSIAKEGVKEPLTVYMEDGVPVIENGHCRHAAMILAAEKYGAVAEELTAPVIVSSKDASEAERLLSQIIRNGGKPLNPLEQAVVFAKLGEAGLSDADIAEKCGVHRVYVGQLALLAGAPAKLKALVRDNRISATLAIEVIKANKNDYKKALKILVETVKEIDKIKPGKRVTAKDVEAAVEEKAKKKGKSEDDEDAEVAPKKKRKAKAAVEEAGGNADMDEVLGAFTSAVTGIAVENGVVTLELAEDAFREFAELIGYDLDGSLGEDEDDAI